MIELLKLILFFFLYPFKKIITPKNIIILSSNAPNRYGGGPKFLFEYLSKKKFQTYWWTSDRKIQDHLIKKKLRYFSISNPLKFLKVVFTAKIVINSGDDHYDFCNLLKNDSRVVKICVGHGMGPKLINKKKNHPLQINFDYLSYSSLYTSKNIAQAQFKIDKDKIKILGNPKNDLFFNKKKIKDIYQSKKISNFYIKNLIKKSKIIFYAPTWRPYKFNLPLLNLNKFDLKKFDYFLKKNNFYFFYNSHVQSSIYNKINTDRIKFISTKTYSLFDTNNMLCECDIFLTDCSTLSTEAAILKKPQILIFPDFKKYNNVHGFIEPFKDIIPGKVVYNFDDLLNLMYSYKNKKNYSKKFNEKVKKYLDHYYDTKIDNSAFRHKNFIKKLINFK